MWGAAGLSSASFPFDGSVVLQQRALLKLEMFAHVLRYGSFFPCAPAFSLEPLAVPLHPFPHGSALRPGVCMRSFQYSARPAPG